MVKRASILQAISNTVAPVEPFAWLARSVMMAPASLLARLDRKPATMNVLISKKTHHIVVTVESIALVESSVYQEAVSAIQGRRIVMELAQIQRKTTPTVDSVATSAKPMRFVKTVIAILYASPHRSNAAVYALIRFQMPGIVAIATRFAKRARSAKTGYVLALLG